jgi:signal peptidase I
VWPVSRFGTLDSPDIQDLEAAAGLSGSVAPVAIGLAGALPVVLWRRERRALRDL